MSQHAFLLALHPEHSYLPGSLSCRPPDFTMGFWYYFVKPWEESNVRPKSWRTELLPPPSTPFLISLNMISHVPDDLHSPSCTVRSATLTKHEIMPKHSMDKADIAPVPSFAGMVSLPRSSLVPSSLGLRSGVCHWQTGSAFLPKPAFYLLLFGSKWEIQPLSTRSQLLMHPCSDSKKGPSSPRDNPTSMINNHYRR